MHKRQFTIVGIVLIAATILFAVLTYRQQAQDKSQPQQEEATVVKKGQITEKEREYSKEYKKLYSYRKGRKLTELSDIAKHSENRQEIGVSLGEPSIPTVGTSSPITATQFLGSLSCEADAVVVGAVLSKTAHLTEDETFIYTKYEFSVKDVLKNNPASFIEDNKSIQITRPGGLIKLDNQVIRVEDKLYKPLEIKKEYLLFLKFIPSANGYLVSDTKGDFVLENYSFKQLRKFHLLEELENLSNSQAFLAKVRSAISNDCSQQIKGGNYEY